jgi:hypothetical protein
MLEKVQIYNPKNSFKARLIESIKEKMDSFTNNPIGNMEQYQFRLGEISALRECLELFNRYQIDGDE